MKAIWITIFFGISSFVFGQNEDHNLFAQCFVGHTDYVQEIEIPEVEIDDDILMIKFDYLKVPGKPSTKWVKRKTDENCISQDPNDCLVWCLVEVPGYDYILANTFEDLSDRSDFFETEIDLDSMYWQPIMFFENLEKREQKRIIKKLKRKKYLNKKHPIVWSDEVIVALQKYQKDELLPIGNLNFLTLDQFNVEY